jgi:16S rRNA (adenine1518-N6/adenine1519-N6)-dimethyltransferase
VGNLPYSIGAMIIKKTLLLGNDILSCTFMVQREVAGRIVAEAGTKRNGFLSIFCQFFGEPKILFHVPPGAFFPRPKVDSSVVHIKIRPDLALRLAPGQWRGFFSFVDKGFGMRRKILVNALGEGGGKKGFEDSLRRLGIDTMARAEDLDCERWLDLYRISCAA